MVDRAISGLEYGPQSFGPTLRSDPVRGGQGKPGTVEVGRMHLGDPGQVLAGIDAEVRDGIAEPVGCRGSLLVEGDEQPVVLAGQVRENRDDLTPFAPGVPISGVLLAMQALEERGDSPTEWSVVRRVHGTCASADGDGRQIEERAGLVLGVVRGRCGDGAQPTVVEREMGAGDL